MLDCGETISDSIEKKGENSKLAERGEAPKFVFHKNKTPR